MAVRIEVDFRERHSGVLGILKSKDGVNAEEKRLSIGDYRINNSIVVERKTTKDLVVSIIDGRLFSQASRLKRFVERPVIVIEGTDLYHTGYAIAPQAIKGAITSLSITWSIPVILSRDAEGTAQFLIMAGIQDVEYCAGFVKRPGRKPKRMEKLKLHLLQGFPNIGPKIAKRMLDRFGSIERIITADERELALVEGIGRKRALMIKRLVG